MLVAVLLPGRITGYNIDFLKALSETYKCVFFASLNNDSLHQFTDFIREFAPIISCLPTVYPDFLASMNTRQETNKKNMYSMFFHTKRCYDMMIGFQSEKQVCFDVVIKIRPDIEFRDHLVITNCQPNTIYIPKNYDWLGINDQFAYGDQNSMRLYCSIVDELSKYSQELTAQPRNPEMILLHHLHRSNLQIVRFPFAYSLAPLRYTI